MFSLLIYPQSAPVQSADVAFLFFANYVPGQIVVTNGRFLS